MRGEVLMLRRALRALGAPYNFPFAANPFFSFPEILKGVGRQSPFCDVFQQYKFRLPVVWWISDIFVWTNFT